MSKKVVVIIGGSISGLMHALMLKSIGHTVLVLEARSEHQFQARAAGLSIWPNAQKLLTTCISELDLDAITVRNKAIQIIAPDGVLLAEVPVPDDVRTSGWNTVHNLLRDACAVSVEGHDPQVRLVTSSTVLDVYEEGQHMVVEYTGEEGIGRKVADYVIAADGARSYVRGIVLPHVKAKYVGYVAWRGSFAEVEAPEELRGTLAGKLCNVKLDGSYILSYITPDDSGSMQPGNRRIEWCWYDTCDISSSEFEDIMTDRKGVRHNVTVAASQVRPEAWESYRFRRRAAIPPLWAKLFNRSGAPLLAAIRSFNNTKASFLGGKLLLVGEAFTQIRPHLGASCDIAALQALTLPKALEGTIHFEEWERNVADHAKDLAARSKATGVFGMTGNWAEAESEDPSASRLESVHHTTDSGPLLVAAMDRSGDKKKIV